MKKNPNHQNRLLLGCLATAMAVGMQARADFDPIPLTPGSFTADVVVEKTAAPPINAYTTATMDGGTNNNSWTWYEQGYVASWPDSGIPKQGVTFDAITDGSHSFKMAPNYAANNVLLVYTNGSPTGTLTVTAPAAYTALSFLVASGGGAGSFNYVIHYQGGGTQPGSLAVPDWFNNAAAGLAWNANGRVQTDNATFGNLNNTTPNLFFVDVALTDAANPVTSIEFLGTSPNRTLVFAVSGQNLGGSYVPVAVTGYNRDMVVEAAATARSFLLHATTVTMEGSPGNNYGNAWYERGFNPYSTNSGLPPANSTFSTLTNGAHTFRMAPTYATNNVMYMGSFGAYTFGTFTLSTPAAFNALSFLATAANGPVGISANVTFEDFSIETITFNAPDWFNLPGAALNVNGRVNTENAALDTRTDNNPRVYGVDVPLVEKTKKILSIDFTYVSGGRAAIFAVSGQATAGAEYLPIAVSGYNADVVVEAAPQWPPSGLRAYTTATMDGGVNNDGNTWYERGYYPAFPDSGLPPAGSIITSLDKADHHYQMPATYTGNNAAFVDSIRSNVNLTLASPAAYSALSFLSATANNNVTNQVIIEFQDGTRETNKFTSRDWFNNAPYAFTSRGRVQSNDRSINNAGSTNPRLYEAEFALANTTSPVTNVVLQFLGAVNPNTGRMVVLAVSATAGAVRPIIATHPSSRTVMEGTNMTLTAIMGGGDEPITYQWYAGENQVYTPVVNGGVFSGATTPVLTFTGIGWTNATDYILVASNVAGSSTSAVATVTVRSGFPDVTAPTDTISIISGTTGGEPVPNVINNNTTKYLNLDDDAAAPFVGPVGFTVTPGVGATIVKVLRFYTANDAPERDPADYVFEGSNDGFTYNAISSGALNLSTDRNGAGQPLSPTTQVLREIRLANNTSYTSYKVSFNNIRDNNTTYMMQIGEVEFLGTLADIAGPPVVRRDVPAKAVVYAGRTLKLSAIFGGTTPLNYAWQKNGAPLSNGARVSGANTDTLTIVNVDPSDAGSYQLLVSNSQGGPTPSGTTAVTVEPVPDFNTDGAGWSLNGPTITDNVMTLTEALNDQRRSAFYQEPLYVGGFKATFTYQDVTTAGADGFAFVAHNAPAGPMALGGGGGDLGYVGITPSAALMFNIYNSLGGIALGTGGARQGDYTSTAPVNISTGNPIAVELVYHSGVMDVTLTDAVSNSTFSVSLPLNIPSLVGSNTAYVGFTGATGGVNAQQTISNFQYFPLPTLASVVSGQNVILSWPAAIGGYKLQSRTDVATGTWQDVATAPVLNGANLEVTVPISGARFYRLSL